MERDSRFSWRFIRSILIQSKSSIHYITRSVCCVQRFLDCTCTCTFASIYYRRNISRLRDKLTFVRHCSIRFYSIEPAAAWMSLFNLWYPLCCPASSGTDSLESRRLEDRFMSVSLIHVYFQLTKIDTILLIALFKPNWGDIKWPRMIRFIYVWLFRWDTADWAKARVTLSC